MKISVRRSGALGDVVLTTPVVQRLHEEFPSETIEVLTAYPDVYRGSPHAYADCRGRYPSVDRFIDLDMAYERRPNMHIVEAYMEEAFGDRGRPGQRQQDLYFPRKRVFAANPNKKYVAVHAAKAGWANRTLPRSFWVIVLEQLRKSGFWPILVGTERDDIPDPYATRFFSHDIHAQASLIASCSAFVGSDSGLLHVAGATDTPIVGIFTCADPAFRMPWRHGSMSWQATAVVADIECVGCLHRRLAPVTTELCERVDNACIRLVDPYLVVDAVCTLIDSN